MCELLYQATIPLVRDCPHCFPSLELNAAHFWKQGYDDDDRGVVYVGGTAMLNLLN